MIEGLYPRALQGVQVKVETNPSEQGSDLDAMKHQEPGLEVELVFCEDSSAKTESVSILG